MSAAENAFDILDDQPSIPDVNTGPEVELTDDAPIDTTDISHHPLMKDNAILPTRALEEFVNAVRLWLDNLLPGAIIFGLPRIGKTQGIRYLMDNVSDLLGSSIPITLISCWEYTASGTTENRFFSEMLHALGYELVGSGTAALKRRRVIDCMVERAADVHEHRYLILVDEARWLSDAHYRFLMDLHNQLKMADIRLIVLLVGQPELQEIKENLRSARKRHLLGRFMTGSHRFTGVVGLPDFRRMLMALDQGSEYPAASGISFTQYFVPKAFAVGWRLSAHADRIWSILDTVCRRENIPKTDELPIQPLTACLRWLLKTLNDMDQEALELNDSFIEEAIYRVALLQIEDHASLGAPAASK